jgi:hypothetical protein
MVISVTRGPFVNPNRHPSCDHGNDPGDRNRNLGGNAGSGRCLYYAFAAGCAATYRQTLY